MDENDNGLKRTAIKPASTCQHTVAIWNWLLMVYFHKIYFITNVIFYRKKLYFSKLIYLMLQKIKVETIIFEIHLIFWSCCWSLQKAKKNNRLEQSVFVKASILSWSLSFEWLSHIWFFSITVHFSQFRNTTINIQRILSFKSKMVLSHQ